MKNGTFRLRQDSHSAQECTVLFCGLQARHPWRLKSHPCDLVALKQYCTPLVRNDWRQNVMNPEDIKQRIEAGLPHSEAHVEGDGAHFTAAVMCPAFAGKSRIERQQLVYNTVKSQLLDGTLHALSVKTYTPDEIDQSNNQERP